MSLKKMLVVVAVAVVAIVAMMFSVAMRAETPDVETSILVLSCIVTILAVILWPERRPVAKTEIVQVKNHPGSRLAA